MKEDYKDVLETNGMLTLIFVLGIIGAFKLQLFLLLPFLTAIFAWPIARGQYELLRVSRGIKE